MKITVLVFLMAAGNLSIAQEHKIKTDETALNHVVVFIGCECPISQKYVSRLNDTYLRYEHHSNLKWSFIVPGKVSKKKIRAFTIEYNVKFPLKPDDRKSNAARFFHSTVTPEVIIRSNKILYQGAIDNWFFGLGKYGQAVTEASLIDAIEAILKGQDPVVKETEAVGCPFQLSHF